MARMRTIKPGFFTNDALAEIEPLGRLLFAGLWCLADRDGRLEDRPKRIKAEILPYDACDVDALLGDLAKHGFVVRYAASDGERYLQVVNFSKHQWPHHREAASTIPAPGPVSGQVEDMPTESPGLAQGKPDKSPSVVGISCGYQSLEDGDAQSRTTTASHHDDNLAALTSQVVSECRISKASQGGAQRIIASHLDRGMTPEAVLREVDKLVDRNAGRKKPISLSELDGWLSKARLVGPVPIVAVEARASPPTADSTTPAPRLRTAAELSPNKTPFRPRYPGEIDDDPLEDGHGADTRSTGQPGSGGRPAGLRAG